MPTSTHQDPPASAPRGVTRVPMTGPAVTPPRRRAPGPQQTEDVPRRRARRAAAATAATAARRHRLGAVAAVGASTVGALAAVGLVVALGAPDAVVERLDAVTLGPVAVDEAAPATAPRLALVTRAWRDDDGDGLRSDDEGPLPDVLVQLETADAEPARDVRGRPVPPVSTGDDGTATFTGVPDGVYRVRYVLPAGHRLTTPLARPGRATADSDADPVDAGGTVGLSGPLALTAEELDLAPAGLDAERVLRGVDVGVVPAAEVLDAVG